MCQPNCLHSELCLFQGTGYECDLNNDKYSEMCGECKALNVQRHDFEPMIAKQTTVTRYPVLIPIPKRLSEQYPNAVELDEMPATKTRNSGWTPEGYMNLQECHTMTGFHVYQDDELTHILNHKANQVNSHLLTFASNHED